MTNSLHEQQFTGLETLTPERQKSVSSTGSASALKFPSDMTEANRQVGAACGHFALAASLGSNVMDVVKYFPSLLERKSWCSVKTMEIALALTGAKWKAVGAGWPARGPMIVQGLGPWMKKGVPFAARLTRTHWIATVCTDPARGRFVVADANGEDWLPFYVWETTILADMLKRWGAEGWEVKRGYEVTLNDPKSAAEAAGENL